MKRKVGHLQGVMAAIGMLVLILDSRLALDGARSGMELCVKTVIPSLFPFFVLSILLTAGLVDMDAYFLKWLTSLLQMPQSAVPVLIPAFLGGYPVGAKCVGELYHGRQIDKQQAERMLAFCSNAGPSFLFGMVSGFFPEQKWIWLLWLIIVASAVLTAVVLPAPSGRLQRKSREMQLKKQPVIYTAAKAMAVVCCWVVLFRMILTFLDAWFLWLLPGWLQVLISGVLELTNGCCALMLIKDLNVRFVLCAVMLSFGGICVLLQTASVTNGLSLGCYLRGKMIQAVFSFLLSGMIAAQHGWFGAALIPLFVVFLRKTQNRYGNPGTVPV